MIGRRHPLHAHMRMHYAMLRGYCTHGEHASLRWREGLESHSVPLFSFLCLPRGRSLKWPPSRQSLIGRDIPSFCVLQSLFFSSLFLFTSDALIVYRFLRSSRLFFFCAKQDFELHSHFSISLTLLSVDVF